MKETIEGNLISDSTLYVNGLPVINLGQYTQVGIRVQVNAHRVVTMSANREHAVAFLVKLKSIGFPFDASIVTIDSEEVIQPAEFNTWTVALIRVIAG